MWKLLAILVIQEVVLSDASKLNDSERNKK